MRAGVALRDEGRLASRSKASRRRRQRRSQRLGSALGRAALDPRRRAAASRCTAQMPRVQNSAVAFMRHLRERGFTQAPDLLGTALDHRRRTA